jgi:hypothetical protein
MKTSQTIIIVSLIMTSFSWVTCSEHADQEMQPVKKIDLDTLTFKNSLKGWELYSWPNGTDWTYSLLGGTNRLKSYEEVRANEIIVCGIDSLKMLLARLPENEQLFWIGEGWLESCWDSDYGNLSLPDRQTVREIQKYCGQIHLVLHISD